MSEEGRESWIDKLDITKYPVKSLVAIPLIILLIALVVLGYTQLSVGSPLRLGMDFKGGTWVEIATNKSCNALTEEFADFPVSIVGKTGIENKKRIEFGPMSETQRDALIDKLNGLYGAGSYGMESISPVFGTRYLYQTLWAVLIAFTLMSIVVFAAFRSVVPSTIVILSAFSDIVVAIACVDLIGMKLSLGMVAALLMLIGYSVDTDILLTTNLLRKRGDLTEKLRIAMKTGIMMTSTTLSAVFAMFIVSYFIDIPVLEAISIVLLFGLVADMMNTWMLNAGLLRWYIEKEERKKYIKRGTKKVVTKGKTQKKVKA